MHQNREHRSSPAATPPGKRPLSRRCVICAVVLSFLLPMPAGACPIPVYQYALEWWDRDPYDIYVFDTGVMTEDEQAALDLLEGVSSGRRAEEIPANVRLFHVRAESEDRIHAHAALRGEKPASLPWMAAYYPSLSRRMRAPMWTGKLNTQNVQLLLDSPMRRKICELLEKRVSTVWVLLESGARRADAAAARRLESELKRLQETLVPPDPSKWGWTDMVISDIRFETLRLSRNDPEERMLVAMLLNSEPDLKDFDLPIVFPIFGRGLVMPALVGDGVNPQMIRETAEFLTGSCSCTVKAANPGKDLITTFDWNARVKPLTTQVTLPPGGLGAFLDGAEQLKKDPNADNQQP